MNNKTYTLIIWEEIPEQTKLFIIPNEVADKYRHFLDQAHNTYININEMNDGLCFLNYAVNKNNDNEEEEDNKHKNLFLQYQINYDMPLINQNITYVYHSGFVL